MIDELMRNPRRASTRRAPARLSHVAHDGAGVFRELPTPFQATRYHSLVVERDSMPDALDITAESEDGLVMGLQHKSLPIHGVQFHPESIASEHGHQILRNFLDIAEAWNGRRQKRRSVA